MTTIVADISTAPWRAEVQPRHEKLHAQIIDYLAHHGASRCSDILANVSVCKDTLYTHLKRLETAQVIRCDIPPEQRVRATPYYSLQPTPQNGRLARS